MLFPKLSRRVLLWHGRRETIRRLRALDDRLLVDLGTSRDTIDSFVDRRTAI